MKRFGRTVHPRFGRCLLVGTENAGRTEAGRIVYLGRCSLQLAGRDRKRLLQWCRWRGDIACCIVAEIAS